MQFGYEIVFLVEDWGITDSLIDTRIRGRTLVARTVPFVFGRKAIGSNSCPLFFDAAATRNQANQIYVTARGGCFKASVVLPHCNKENGETMRLCND